MIARFGARMSLPFGVLVGLALSVVAPAQKPVVADDVRFEFTATPGYQISGYGWATLHIDNRSDRTREIEVEFATQSWRNTRFSFTRDVQLAPGERSVVHMPIPGLDVDGYATIKLDGESIETRNFRAFAAREPSVLFISDDPAHPWKAELTRLAPARGRRRGDPVNAPIRDCAALPDRWQWLTGFAVVIVDGGTRGLDETVQQRLLDLLAAGGRLLVTNTRALPPGPLAAVVGGATNREPIAGTHAFGEWRAIARGDVDTLPASIEAWLVDPPVDLFQTRIQGFHGPAPALLHHRLAIPGVGEVPAKTFFFLLLGFAIFVGPINHFLVRRRHPALMLITVPVAGIGFTAVILLYGILSEGFSIRGAIQSVTLLDQSRQHATSVAARTLYAGRSPNALTPSPDTYLASTDLEARWRDPMTHALEVDLASGRMSGAAVPSRIPTTWVSATTGTARPRIRFRRLADRRLEVLAGPELAPIPSAGKLVLRTIDGDWFVSGNDGRLAPVDEAEGQLAFAALKGIAGEEVHYRDRLDNKRELEELRLASAWVERALGPELQPGCYLAAASANAAVDDLGIEVEYLSVAHLVHGQLAPEDILD